MSRTDTHNQVGQIPMAINKEGVFKYYSQSISVVAMGFRNPMVSNPKHTYTVVQYAAGTHCHIAVPKLSLLRQVHRMPHQPEMHCDWQRRSLFGNAVHLHGCAGLGGHEIYLNAEEREVIVHVALYCSMWASEFLHMYHSWATHNTRMHICLFVCLFN